MKWRLVLPALLVVIVVIFCSFMYMFLQVGDGLSEAAGKSLGIVFGGSVAGIAIFIIIASNDRRD